MTDVKQRKHRHRKIRTKVNGTTERPRLVVFRSANSTYAQLIDDTKGVTVASASDLKSKKSGMDGAAEVGAEIAKKAKDAKVSTAVFDRNGYKYHGRVKAVAEAAREAGLTI